MYQTVNLFNIKNRDMPYDDNEFVIIDKESYFKLIKRPNKT